MKVHAPDPYSAATQFGDDEVVPRVEDVLLVDGVLEGAFGGKGDEDFAIGEGLDEEAWVDTMNVLKFEVKEEHDDEE
ncbi:hypothetical protein Tco_0723484 [Tanacetum coccineum]